MPSDFQLKTADLGGYNNKMLIASNDMKIGKNLIILPIFVKPDKSAFKAPSSKNVMPQKLPLYKVRQGEAHDNTKTTLIIVGGSMLPQMP